MTKTQFTELLAQRCSVPASHAARILNAFLDSVEDALFRDGRLALKGLGSFDVRTISARRARHPATGELMQIAPFKTVRFKLAGSVLD